jgi:NADH-quinone oxidoreductase subunit N
MAGGSQEAAEGAPVGPRGHHLEVVFVAVVCAVATVVFGIYPEPLFDIARDAGEAFSGLL